MTNDERLAFEYCKEKIKSIFTINISVVGDFTAMYILVPRNSVSTIVVGSRIAAEVARASQYSILIDGRELPIENDEMICKSIISLIVQSMKGDIAHNAQTLKQLRKAIPSFPRIIKKEYHEYMAQCMTEQFYFWPWSVVSLQPYALDGRSKLKSRLQVALEWLEATWGAEVVKRYIR